MALVVVSCHIDKLLTGGKTPPSDAPPARVAFSSSLGSARARAGDPITPPVQVNVQDSAGRVTLRDTLITLSLAANPGGAKLRGDTVAHSVDGVATFANIRLDKAASGYTLTAAAPNLHPDTSAAFSVMPAPATDLQFTVQPRQPSAAMQDSAIKPPVQVTAYDSLGNKVINFTGLVGVTLGNDGSVTKKATLSGGDPVPAVAGVATFPNLRIDQAGVGYTLTAAFGTAQPVDTSTAFNITPGPPPPATHLAFTQQPPQTTQAGAAIVPPVQIAALDAAEHVVQGFTGAIGLALEPASNGGTLSGGDPVNAVNGIATFANLSINKAGTGYTLRATAPPLTDATSSAFAVRAPPSGSLRVTTSTSGDNLDTDGYTVTVDGTTSQSIGNNSSGGVTFSGLSVSNHTVELTGVANNCTVTAPNPRTVAVTDGATAVTAFVVTCTALTGSITVTTATTGSSLPSTYTVTLDGGSSRTIPADNGSTTYDGLSTTNHTVALTDVPGNCTVTGGASKTVPVTAGQTATAAFKITCTALTGSLTVTTATTGSSLPSTYTVTLDGGSSRTISADGGTTTYDGLSTTTHTVALTDVPGNCTVTGGASKTVPVTAGQTATAAFTITCSALTGSLTVTTATTGSSQPSTYTVTVDGGQSRTISANGGTTTYSGLSATTHTVALTDVPANCTVSGGASHSVTVTASQTTTEPFSISCAATTGSLAVTTTTTGPEQPSGYTVSVSGGGSQSIGTNQTITFTDLAPGSHSVALNGAPSNCSVSGGPSQTVNVTAGQTATASFTISCVATTGSLTVTAATTGSSQPSTYTVTVDGGQSRTISANGGTTTYSGLSARTPSRSPTSRRTAR
ncbi:MAG: hypothetical protein DMD25_13140 [Gemmatimonadetes bacterium]|nr:MAG: hypothetical protein DMD25_13140 [Gemmatimonadota bacterium]